MKPIKLTDAELDAVFSAARPLDPDLSEKDVETYGLLKAHLRRTASEFGRMVCCEKRSRSVPTQKPTARLDVESAACRLPPRVRFGFGGGKSIRPIYFSPASTRGLFFVRRSPRLRNQQRA